MKTADREKKIAIDFFYWWHNQPGQNTEAGFDEYKKTERYKMLDVSITVESDERDASLREENERMKSDNLNANSEVEKCRDRIKELEEALKEARQRIGTQISSIQYSHAPKEFGMRECAKLAEESVAADPLIQLIDKALNPQQP